MESQPSNLCCGCLAVERRMLLIKNTMKEQCFLEIIKELSISLPNAHELWLCWECEALVTKFTKFKLQVKHSYQILHEITIQSGVPHTPKLTIHNIANITVPDPEDESEHVLDATVTVKIEKEPIDTTQIKNETDFSDDDDKLLIDISNKDSNGIKLNEQDIKTKVKIKKNGKMKIKRNGKVKIKKNRVRVKKKCIYNEIQLSLEEINGERSELALRDDYVNAMFRCERCIVSFPNEDDMKEHIFKKHEAQASKHKCSICERSFSTEVSYKYHQSRHYRRFECLVCRYRCTSKLAVRNHCSTVHFQSAVNGLEQKLLKSYGFVENGLNSTKSEQKFPCEYCPKVFGWKTSLRKHSETHKIEAGQKRRPYCEPCRLSFTTTANLQKHVKTSSKHQIQLKLRKLEMNPDESNDKEIADIKSSVNSKRELFSCAQCDKKFQWRGNLLRHVHSHAARANGELVCEPCNRTFSSIATYTQHMKISKKHTTENDYKYMCSDCGKKFASKTKLKDHVDWDHLKNYVHTCTDCQKVFKTHTSLYLHRQVVHKQASGHLCENCGKSFPNQTKLRSHTIALHTSESPYKCGVCGARFSWHSCLSRHLRRVHRTNTITSSTVTKESVA